MKRIYDPKIKATVTLDDKDQVRGVNYLDEFYELKHRNAHEGVKAYFHSIAETLNITHETLHNLDCRVSYLDPRQQNIEYHLSEEKTFFDTTTYAYYQTYLNTPIWGAGITVTIQQNPARVISATNTSEYGVDAKLPSLKDIERFKQLFSAGEKIDEASPEVKTKRVKTKNAEGSKQLIEILGEAAERCKSHDDQQITPALIRGRFFVYRYDSSKRNCDHSHQNIDGHGQSSSHEIDQPCCGVPPTLPLPPVPNSIQEGHCYLVAELVFRLPFKGRSINWCMLVEIETNSILYLRALTSGVNGLVFANDPITATGNATNSPAANNASLNPLRTSVQLLELVPPAPASNQELTGSFIQISDFELATAAPPTEALGTDFNYNARTDNFSAVNAYYHCDRFFRLVEDLGFTISNYFDGTNFPIPVDHRGRFGSADGIERNASCSGDGDGISNVDFELADLTDTTNPMGIAADWRVVLHELGGHGIIYDHAGSGPNFGFSHSAGDSFAVILNDPATQASDRFESFPWVNFIGRRHDRTVAAGWGWGGVNDDKGYLSEQILSTTMFRVYRSIGGDSTQFSRREFSARCMAYLMLRAVGTLTPMSNPNSPAQFLDALLAADAGDWTTEGLFGGAYGKVLTWSFEKQNLNAGVPPLVDVYIDDGRAGEYEYLPVYWETTAIWNRHTPDGLGGHQEPTIGTNYAYLKIKNRGTSVANDVVVKAFHCKPSAGLVWPKDLQPMTTSELSAGTIQPNNSEEKTIGPFEWTPVINAIGHDSMLMVVSAFGDPSNVDNFTAVEEIEDWRLVPNDNNVALKNVKLVPRLVTVIADSGNFGNVCIKAFKDVELGVSNGGFNALSITSITSSSPEFLVPSVLSYPIIIQSGNAIEVPIRLQPNSFGPKAATITVFSNDPSGPKLIAVSGKVGAPRLALMIADTGHFGNACIGSFVDEILTLNNSGDCTLTITNIASSSGKFLIPSVLSYPLTIEAGSSLQVPIRFQPTNFGTQNGIITVISDDPSGAKSVNVSGYAPSGKLALTGSTCIGGVKAGCLGERTISICNVGDCKLHVISVAFKRESKHWKLINNPFPAALHPGSCLSVLIRYKATEKCPKCCELVITSDDPAMPVKILDVMAYTIWNDCGCKNCCDDCQSGSCEKHHNQCCSAQSIDMCCDDEGHDD